MFHFIYPKYVPVKLQLSDFPEFSYYNLGKTEKSLSALKYCLRTLAEVLLPEGFLNYCPH